MVCKKCNAQVDESAKFCPVCGNNLISEGLTESVVSITGINNSNVSSNENVQDKTNVWLVILSWFVPIAGLIIFLVQKKTSPKTAKASGLCALISAILSLLIIVVVFFFIISISTYNTYKFLDVTEEKVDDIIDYSNKDGYMDDYDDVDDYDEKELSNWQNYLVNFNGKVLTIPMSYSKLANVTGFSMKTADLNSVLADDYYALVNLYDNEKLALYVEIINDTDMDLGYSDCDVSRISQTKYQVEQGATAFCFPGNIKVGQEITEDTIVKLLGNPSNISNYVDGDYSKKTYSYYSDSVWTTTNYYEIEVVNGVIDSITLDNRD